MQHLEIDKDTLKQLAAFTHEAALETLWPTRCVICDYPGDLLCEQCRKKLSYIDPWSACERCGAPFGLIQCSECNPAVTTGLGDVTFCASGAVSALIYDAQTKRIISAYKDRGERRLSTTMAEIMASYAKPLWRNSAYGIAFIPSSVQARRMRGFDHAELLAQELGKYLGLPSIAIFCEPKSHDQRKLSREERLANLEGRISLLPGASPPKHLILIDDVCTTGATLSAATNALHEGGCEDVWCLTFARAW